MRKHRLIQWLLLLMLSGFAFTSCRMIKLKLGIGYTVENPDPDSPEAVMQNVLKALTIRDPQKSWSRFLPLLHTHEHGGGYINTWRKMKFKHMRNVVNYYILDPSTYSFKVKRVQEGLEDTLILYIASKKTDIPTPCKFKRDPHNGNAWRVYSSCL